MARAIGTRRQQRSMDLWQQSARAPLMWWELYTASLQTIGARMGPMMAGGVTPDSRQRRENQRMTSEKAQAGLETVQFMFRPNLALPFTLMQTWAQLWRPQSGWLLMWDLYVKTAEQSLAAYTGTTKPWHRRATANAKRLNRPRKS